MFKQKTVLITGASRGIGLLTVKTLGQAGHYVVAAMRDIAGKNKDNAEALREWSKQCSGLIEVIEMDITDERAVNAGIQSLEQRLTIDVLINNAGVMPVGITEAYTPAAVRDCFDTNVIGALHTSRAILPFMRKRKSGLLIHVSSTAGRLAIPYFGVYCASKWALEALVESMHYELESFGIESIIVEPGGHATDLISNPPAADDSNCILSYGAKAEYPHKMIAIFKDMFADENPITNAQNVADEINALIAMTDKRPIRTTVGNDMGLNAINKEVAPIQAELIESLQPVIGTIDEDNRLYISADICLKPEYFQQGKLAIESILKPTLSEPGCHVFSLMESQTETNTLHLFEVFDNEQALEQHYQQSYTQAVFTNYDTWLAKPITVRKMKSASIATSM